MVGNHKTTVEYKYVFHTYTHGERLYFAGIMRFEFFICCKQLPFKEAGTIVVRIVINPNHILCFLE